MARLRLTLLGGLRARLPSGQAVALPSKKAQALLAYLARSPGRAHPRDQLAALLWGDASDGRARHSLRQALVVVRHALAQASPVGLAEAGTTVALNPAALELDVEAFERWVAEGTPEALERAVALYQGDFLAGLGVQEAPFEEWLLTERERLRELALEALARLLAHQSRTGAVEAAVDTAVRLLGLDPVQEAAHRALMRLYVQQGRRGAALHQYQVCVGLLQRELGVEPEAETRELYEALLRERRPRPPMTAPPAAASRSPGPIRIGVPPDAVTVELPLIGRQAELAALRDALDKARQGRGRLVVVLGEAGIGRSRLLMELAADVWRTGGVVLVGHAYETAQVLPFGPWVDALRTGRVIPDEALIQDLDPVWRAELARLFPELGEPGLQVPAAPENSVRLFEALAQFIESLAARAPWLLVLEDLHWADEMSLRLLAFLARRLQTAPVLLMATAREEDLPDAPVFRQLLQELDRDRSLLRLRLTPLSQEETAALVRALARAGTDPVQAARLSEEVRAVSAGNPFIVVETMRALEQGRPLQAADVLPLPERVRALITGRLERLGPGSRELVAVAAVIGRVFDFALLHRAAGQDDRAAAEGMEELVRRHILHGVGDGFDFTHDRIRAVAYESLLPPRRQTLHAAVARALESLYAGRLEQVYDRLALHYSRTDQAEPAVTYLARLAEQAARVYDHREAVTALREALGRVPGLPADGTRDRRLVDLTLRQAQSLYFLGRFQEGVELLLRQETRLAQLPDASLSGAYYFWLSYLCTRLNQHERAVRSARRAVDEARRSGDVATMGKAYGVLGVEAYWAGDCVDAVEYARQGISLLEETRERWWLGMAYFNLGLTYLHMGAFTPALEAEARVQAIGAELADPGLESYGLSATGWTHAACGEWDAAIEECRRAVTRASDPASRNDSSALLGYAYLEQGDHAQAIGLLEEAIEQLGRFEARQFQGWVMVVLGEAYRLSGQIDRARDLASRGLTLTRDAGNRHGVAWAQRALGRIARGEGGLSEAEARLDEALQTFASVQARFEAARTHLDLAELAAARGDAGAVSTHLTESHRVFAALRVPRYVGRAEALATTLGVALE